MLSISAPISGSSGRGNYYLGLAQEDYYARGGEAVGRWVGEGAKLFGLKDPVQRQDFKSLLEGYSHYDGSPLVQNAGRPNRQAAWDLTFSAPKSVSVLWSQLHGKERHEIQKAQQSAVEAALGYLQHNAAFTRRGKGGSTIEASPLIIATFEHGTSRALDPQLHTHALVFNIAFRQDGTTGSIVSREFFREKMAAGAIYQTELAAELRHRLGLELECSKQGFTIKGVPVELCDEFSKRRKDIVAALHARGLEGSAKAAKIAALDTRPKKLHVPREELSKAWRDLGQRHGWSVTQARELVLEREFQPVPPNVSKLKALEQTVLKAVEQTVGRVVARETGPKVIWPTKVVTIRADSAFRQRLGSAEALKVARNVWAGVRQNLQISVGKKEVFPSAPKWRPFSGWILPYVAIGKEHKKKLQIQRPLAEMKLPIGRLIVKTHKLFPGGPKWNPAGKIEIPFLAFDLRERDRPVSPRL